MVFLLAFSLGELTAQQHDEISDLSKLPVDQAEHLINEAVGSQAYFDMVSAALSSRRMDLIELCFNNQFTRFILPTAVTKLQDEDFRDKIVLLMLKSNSEYWPNDNPLSASSFSPSNPLDEPVITTLRRILPNLALRGELVETHAARLALAEKLERAITNEGSGENPPPSEPPPQQKVRQSEMTAPAAPPEPLGRPGKEETKTSVEVSEPRSYRTLAIIGIFFAAIAALWLIRKLRKR